MEILESALERAPTSEILSAVNFAYAPLGLFWGSMLGIGGDPKVMLLVTFIDLAKKNCDARTNGLIHDRLESKNSDLDSWK